MYKNLRILFTVLSAVCLAAAIPLGIFFDFVGIISALLGAGVFFMLMLLCKQSQEFAEAKQKKTPFNSAKTDDNGAGEATADGEPTEGATAQNAPKNAPKAPVKKPTRYRRNKK